MTTLSIMSKSISKEGKVRNCCAKVLIFLEACFAFFAYSLGAADCMKKYELTVCAVFQDEDFYLKEWLEFHKIVGVQHFYLYNNLSSDTSLEILKPYVESGLVEVIDWPVQTASERDYLENLQLPVYNHALKIAEGTSQWIAFIDLDEFLFPVKHSNLTEMLKDYQDCAGLGVNWQNFGTSWLETLPDNGLIIENLVYKAEREFVRNRIVKMIVQPQFVKEINNPHYFDFAEGYFAVDSSKRKLAAGEIMHPVVIDKVRINHYWSGTYDWLIHHKLPRRERWGLVFAPDVLELLIETLNREKDESALRFLPQLKESMFDMRGKD